jgi:hypothetical protein
MAPSVCVFMAQFTTYTRMHRSYMLISYSALQKLVSTLVLRLKCACRFNAQQTMRNSKIIIIYNTI